MNGYQNFRVLLDEPSDRPVLGFETYAKALSELIRESTPQFAIGVFGEWGSGKTTLLQAIDRQLDRCGGERVIRVHFNAWRYERERHLVVPLLDTLREALAAWAAAHALPRSGWTRWRSRERSTEPAPAASAYHAAATVGRAARALLEGLTVKANVPLLTEASLDFGKVSAALRRERDDRKAAEQPLSFYHRSFQAMKQAIEPFLGDGERRIVVFVDDLDRCLPENALEVLESMKLLFDLRGFVVVGLNKQVIERAIELKYGGAGGRSPEANPGIRGADYVKKIFQVPYSLPRIRDVELRGYFGALLQRGKLPKAQREHFEDKVGPHLQYFSGGNAVNPREIKRLLNAYVLQLKMLAPKFSERENETFEPEVVLALQAMSFRADWEHLYDALATDPALFVQSLRPLADGGPAGDGGGLWLGDEETPVPSSFLAYLRTRGRHVLRDDLETYVSSLESSRSTGPGVIEMQRSLGRLRGALRRLSGTEGPEVDSALVSDFRTQLKELERNADSVRDSGTVAETLYAQLPGLREAVQRLGKAFGDAAARDAWISRFGDVLNRVDGALTELRRQTTVGAVAS